MNRKSLAFRAVALAAMLLCTGALVYASGTQQESGDGDLEALGFRTNGYPIVDTAVTIEAVIQRPGHLPKPYSELTLLNDVQEKTNVFIDWEELPDAQAQERVNLMFASREFPDVFFNAGGGFNDTNIYTAGRGGDIYPLNDLIVEYAPNWRKVFDENPLIERSVTFPDGNIYSLPYARDFPADYKIRDIQLMNTDWMEKVGVEMPSTLNEFRDVLRAFKDGIEDGTLPERGVPWYFRFRQWVGGEFEIYGSFRIWAKDSTFLSVNDGQVEYAATDPKMVDALEYLHDMYAEGLFPEEVFTDPWDDYVSKIRSDPPVAGSFGSFHNPGQLAHLFDAIPPLPAEGVDRPLFRSQPIRLQKNQFSVMTKFAYPEVAVRFINEFADPLTALEMSYGRVGHEILEEGDNLRVLGVSADYLQHAPHNFIAAFIPRSISDRVIWEGDLGRRDAYVRNIYEPYVWPQERHYPAVSYTEDEQEELSILTTEIGGYIEETHADWIVNGGAAQGWDAYVAQLDALGLDRLLEIYQAALDRFYGN